MIDATPARRVPPVAEVFADEDLRRAAALAEAGDAAQIRALRIFDLDAVQPSGVNLLMYEIAACNEVAVRTLIDAGADPNALTATGASPMLVAGASEDPRWLEVLLEKGGDPNLKNQFDEPLLTLLVPYGRWDNTQLLLDRGARIDETGPAKQTATYLYATLHQFDRVHALLERGADPTRTDVNGLGLRDFVRQRIPPGSPQEPWRERVMARIGASE
ncbi:ankyrin repeat domain-containing protein [Chondromyces apiculatus]|uniref:Ankyrin-like protein n=1 Tax=Chondromyces apiculatus DSM 436 TaxID=1192034 RepID=A0A017T928_9BACT|nr:ankyrin repeat domain-containing protein [Chondromyces apiculatus]EYF05452.1 ankyrin-like protein [Chondromyces apiculatus DSM 436]